MVGVLVNRDHHKLCVGQQRFEPAHTLDAVDAGQIDVHECYLGLGGGHAGYRVFARPMIAHAGEVLGTVDPACKDFARLGVVFNNGYPDGHWQDRITPGLGELVASFDDTPALVGARRKK